MKINIDEIAYKFKFRDDIDFPASLTVIIGQFEIRGFSIRKSKYPSKGVLHAVYPPSKNIGGAKWLHLFFTPDKKEWTKLEKAILDQFYKKQEIHLMNEMENMDRLKDVEF